MENNLGEYTANMNEYPNLIGADNHYYRDKRGNRIHITAVIGNNVIVGSNNIFGAFTNIVGHTTIGDNNHISPFVSIGSEPEHNKFFKDHTYKGVIIGSNNVIREGVTINAGCYRNTEIGNYVWLLRGVYVAHDCIILDKATISANVLLGGHCCIGEDVNIGLGAIFHQFSVVGSGAMVGMGTIVTKTKKIEPLQTYVGNPAKHLKPNSYKADKLTQEQIARYWEIYKEQVKMNKI